MIFEAVTPDDEMVGATLAHSLVVGKHRLAKGTTLSVNDLRALRGDGVTWIEIARAEPGDVSENDAAERIAGSLAWAGSGLRADEAGKGRVNLRAATAGLFMASSEAVDPLNGRDARIGLATLPDAVRVAAGELVATLKIIPFHVPGSLVEEWLEAVERRARSADAGLPRVSPWASLRVAHISTVLPSLKPTVMDKTRRVLAGRLEPTGARLGSELRVPHEREALSDALRHAAADADIAIVFGASAVTDERDVVPAAVTMAGGRLERVGMPVDPGNLLVLGEVGDCRVIGAPGCARSPARNGFDFVLDRLLAGLHVTSAEIAGMGVGGLLKETARPSPREPQRESGTKPSIARTDVDRPSEDA